MGKERSAVAQCEYKLKVRLTIAMIAWFLLFGIGLFVPSKPYRNYLKAYSQTWLVDPLLDLDEGEIAKYESQVISSPKGETRPWFVLFASIVALGTYAPTNFALLCMAASMIGSKSVSLAEFRRRCSKLDCPLVTIANAGNAATETDSPNQSDTEFLSKQQRGVGMVPGLCVFLLLTSGMILIDGVENWAKPTQLFYGKFAATASLFSIAAGMNPTFMQELANLFSINRNRMNPPGIGAGK